MTTDRISELTTGHAVLHFIVHQLMVAHCEREQDPIAFAQGLLSQIEEMFADTPRDEQWQTEMQEQMQEQMKAFYGQVVSTLRSKTSHHDA